MKLASALDSSATDSTSRDGRLYLIDDKSQRAAPAQSAATLLQAVESWKDCGPRLEQESRKLVSGACSEAMALSALDFLAPLPRTWAFLDGSAFIQHILLVRKARAAEPPKDLYDIPLMYQGLSDQFLGPKTPIEIRTVEDGVDFEGEVAVVLDDVPMGVRAEEVESHICLLLLMNDISLRNLIPRELGTTFGFLHSKPSSSFAPFAVPPAELGSAWRDGRVQLPLTCTLNDEVVGTPHGKEMHFSFFDLVAHAAATRNLSAGTIIGSGTFSNEDPAAGVSCLAEKRVREKIESGEITTPFLNPGDRIQIEMYDGDESVFGAIDQEVVLKKVPE